MNFPILKPNTTNAASHNPQFLLPQIKTMRELKQVHAFLIKTGQTHDPISATELLKLSATSDFRDPCYALKVFDQLPQPNCFAWNTLIRAFAETPDRQLHSLLLFCEMLRGGTAEPNRFTFPSVLKACSVLARLEEGKQVHGLVVKFGFGDDEFVASNLLRMHVMCGDMADACVLFRRSVSRVRATVRDKRREEGNVVLCNVMVDGYVKIGNFGAARDLFDTMHRRSVVSWNAMISGYAQNGFFVEAVELFRKMQVEEDAAPPNRVTLVSVLPAISRLGALELGKWVHLYAERNKIEIDGVLGSALVDMYAKCGSIEKAVQVFERLPKSNVITWNAVIGGLAMHGKADDVFDYFARMERSGLIPSDVTYIAILSACSHGGFVDKGRSYFNRMVNMGFEPRVEHYGCMVDLLGRAGYLKEAEELISNMPVGPDDVIWKALLGACKMHKSIEIGKRAAEVLIKLAPHDSGAYVALSNMYAASENWDAVAEVRLMMKDMDIRKDPGCSWIEIDGVIHEFLVEDESHPRAKEIHSMLVEISEKLNLEGYRPNTTQILLKMDDEKHRESALHYHSEKIAVAFGLVCTSPKTPLQIVKNLRICEDCHSSMKLISRTYDRKIIVRDRKRFHHFEHGSCSCMDYW